MTYAAIVLAGGAARRMGGGIKPLLRIRGRPMLARVLDAVAGASPRLVVGPAELAAVLPSGTTLTCEDPPGGGPVAGIGAALAAFPPGERAVAVLAGDLPLLSGQTIDTLRDALVGVPFAQVALLLDPAGRRQPLLSVWRETALRAALARLGDLDGRAVWRLFAEVPAIEVPAVDRSYLDCDTVEDVLLAEGPRGW
jgi:molybdopterin-guanine dinucleotide biosynthesis protein A